MPDLNKIKSVHFVGIGGIGVSAIARMMLCSGKKVSGSDISESKITKELSCLGASVYIGHRAENLPKDADTLIYTIAADEDNPEISAARKNRIRIMSYPESLSALSKNYFTIAVSGTHGKTTTTAMLSDVLWSAGINPTVIVGSLLKNSGSNFIHGDAPAYVLSKEQKHGVLLLEACEYRRSFLNLRPKILVITNIDNDHLDYFKDMDDIFSAFRELAMKVPEDGAVIADLSDKDVEKTLKGIKARTVDYSTAESAKDFSLSVYGEHNRKNAKAALALAGVLRLDLAKAKDALSRFSGTWRRFEHKGRSRGGAEIYDDYAHHPTEIRATLSGAREKFPKNKIIAVFQPHLYSRTRILLDDFAMAFGAADEVILAPIYAAREPFDPGIRSEDIAKRIGAKAVSRPDFESIISHLGNAPKNSVIITLGAGDIYKVGEALIN